MNSKIRVRFAPSPTGHLHVGNARTAILNWLCARHFGGAFILRIEDTDVERSALESEQSIINLLKWLGLDWDEGPEIEGDYGPYRQSERKSIYLKETEKLLAKGAAYYCFCSKEELERERHRAIEEKRMPGCSSMCWNLTTQEQERLRNRNRKPAVRFRMPEEKIVLNDLVQGEIIFDGANIADFVIQRDDGSSTYNFAVVVDDAHMNITHVIRGNDHVSNTPKQMMLYKALGYDMPEFAHIPMITGLDGVRLSKRHGHSSVEELREAGYLPQALINYLSLLSWSSVTGDELLTAERLIKEFDFKRILRSPAAFDPVKLNWLNGIYLRALNKEELAKQAIPYLESAGMMENDTERRSKIIEAVKDRVETLSEFPVYAAIFFKNNVTISGDEEKELVQRKSSQLVFQRLLLHLSGMKELTLEGFQAVMKSVQEDTGIKGKDLWMPVRIALTGRMHGPELPKVLEILGLEKCIKLLKAVTQKD
ncbi:hypothetical protein AMJ80_07825 [bacterium SM23_31]|nr:MAG: hypothetical protein AMJ80_07825 [bacterium SM23_31]